MNALWSALGSFALSLSVAFALQAVEPVSRHGMSPDTHCSTCHVASSWKELRFDHQTQTGVALRGAHLLVTCEGCHDAAFQSPVPVDCASCHKDAHRGALGVRCQGCHDERNWESRFRADAHRNTAFPLSGRHGLVACEECHGNVRDRSFFRTGVSCANCHQREYARTLGGPVDHVVYGFSTNCYDCHTSSRFTGARYLQHEACFQLATGPHAGIACLGCHSSLSGARPDGKCATGTEACTHCHAHAQARTDAQHTNVPAYQFADLKCYACHPFVANKPFKALAPRSPFRRTP